MIRAILFTLSIVFSIVVCGQTITGRVSDQNGNSLQGATISVKGSFLATSSGKSGNFLLSVPKQGNYNLVISAVGYDPVEQSVAVSGDALRSVVSIQLNRSVSDLKEITITASRRPEVVDRTAASVQIVNANDIRLHAAVSPNLSNILGLTVPSLGYSSNSTSNTGQTLRGRTPLVLVDGIPQSTPLRNGARDMRTMDPSVIERVEVIKGATATYGNGADGGVINYITLKPNVSKPVSTFTSLAKTGMGVHGSETGGFRLVQQVNGGIKAFDYVVSGSYEKTGVYKDAKGVPTDPVYGYGESSIINTFSKLGYNINPNHRVEVMYNYFSSKQNSEYIEQIGKHGVTPTIGVKGPVQGDDEGTRYNHNAYIKYQAKKLFLNTSLEANAYLQKFYTVYGWSASFVPAGQSTIHSDKKGFRLTLNTPWQISNNVETEFLYGIDYLKDITWQSLTDGRLWVPKMEMTNPAPFAQLHAVIHKDWIFKAGYRLDQVDLTIPSFTQIKTTQAAGGQTINGGKLNFSASTFSTGLRYAKWEAFKPFVSFTQGFSMIDIGQYVRSARENDIAKMQLQPVVVNNYEAGFASTYKGISFNTSFYTSTSKIGSTIVEENGYFVQQRAPEKIWGIEAALDIAVIKNLSFGTGVSYMEGKADINKNGSYRDSSDIYLNGRRIIPLKIVSHIRYAPGTHWVANLEWLYSGNRKRFAPQGNGSYRFGEGPVSSYGIVNLNLAYKLNNGVNFFAGVENLLNKDYYPTTSQWYGLNNYYIKANGMRYQLGVSYKW
ncbi:TonB-dependent receptor [Niabella hirudinis]|uniref:TonB-dependent receptor n=1 Tax=Niabella hirudinis TaxID=1285929 RepID=UPI003EB9B7B2